MKSSPEFGGYSSGRANWRPRTKQTTAEKKLGKRQDRDGRVRGGSEGGKGAGREEGRGRGRKGKKGSVV